MMTQPASASAFFNGPFLPPEVLHMIMAKLQCFSLKRCAVVNRQFNKIATPLLWHVHTTPPTPARTQSQAYHQSLVKNAHNIRSCGIMLVEALDIFCPALLRSETKPPQPILPVELPYLQQLKLSIVNKHHVQNTRDMEARIVTWIQSMSLSSIHIRSSISPGTAIAIALSGQLRLKDISLRSSLSIPEAIFFLSNLPSSVQELDLQQISGYCKPETIYEDEKPFTTNHYALRSLNLDCACGRDAYDRFLVPFLATCSTNLKIFNKSRSCEHVNLNVRRALEGFGIHTLVFHSKHLENVWAKDDEIADNIQASTRLEQVYLERYRHVGPLTIATLIGLADTLTLVDLPNHAFISSADVALILSSLEFLTTFRLYARAKSGVYPPCTIFLTAADFLSFEWATKSLSWFECPIQVPRSKAHIREPYRIAELTCEDEHESRAIQRRVYRHLAQQKNLSTLNLDILVELEKCSPQWYSLDITLASGLNELDGVHCLRELRIGGLNHRIRPPDSDWMYQKWGQDFNLLGRREHARTCSMD